MEKLAITKRKFWTEFFKSFGCLGMMIGGLSISYIASGDIWGVIVALTGGLYYFLGFWACYDNYNKN